MRVMGIAIAIAYLSLSGCTSGARSNLHALEAALSRIPVVSVLLLASDPEYAIGCATVVGDRTLLVSPHELTQDEGVVLVDNCLWVYSVVRRVDGPSEASGWALVRLAKIEELSEEERSRIPHLAERTEEQLSLLLETERRVQCELPNVGSVKFDFDSEIPQWTPVAVVHSTLRLDGFILKLHNPNVVPERHMSAGRVQHRFAGPDKKLSEFLRLWMDDDCPFGASGSPVCMLNDDGEPVVIGICGGEFAYDSKLRKSLELVRRPHELELPLQ